MVAQHNKLPGGQSKRNPTPDLDTYEKIKWWKQNKKERAEAVQLGSPYRKSW